MVEVSRANWTAVLVGCQLGSRLKKKGWGDVLVYVLIVVEAGVAFAANETSDKGSTQFADKTVVLDAEIS